jgi:hypothetical protein
MIIDEKLISNDIGVKSDLVLINTNLNPNEKTRLSSSSLNAKIFFEFEILDFKFPYHKCSFGHLRIFSSVC